MAEYTGLGNTWDIFLRRLCVTIVSTNSIPYLLRYVAKHRSSEKVDDAIKGNAAERIINVIFGLFKYTGYICNHSSNI